MLVHEHGQRTRRVFLGLIVAVIAVNLLTFFPSDNAFSARYEALGDSGTNDILVRATEPDQGRFGLAVWISENTPGAQIYSAPTSDLVSREAIQNLLGLGNAGEVLEIHGLSNALLEGVDFDSLIVADAEPYEKRGISPLATGQPWAVALDPDGEHTEFALFQTPFSRFDGAVGTLLIETSALPSFSTVVTGNEVRDAG